MIDGGFRDRCCADVDGFLMIPRAYCPARAMAPSLVNLMISAFILPFIIIM